MALLAEEDNGGKEGLRAIWPESKKNFVKLKRIPSFSLSLFLKSHIDNNSAEERGSRQSVRVRHPERAAALRLISLFPTIY